MKIKQTISLMLLCAANFLSAEESPHHRILTLFQEARCGDSCATCKIFIENEYDWIDCTQDAYVSFCYSEEELQQFTEAFLSVKEQLIEQLAQNAEKSTLVCMIVGGSAAKEILPWLEEEWKEVPNSAVRLIHQEKLIECHLVPSRQLQSPKLLFHIAAPKSSLQTVEGLKERWSYFFAQSLTKSHLEDLFHRIRVPFVVHAEEGLLPSQINLSAFPARDKEALALESLAKEVQQMETEVSEEEWDLLRKFWLNWVVSEQSAMQDVCALSGFMKELNLFDPNISSYEEFLISSEKVLGELSFEEMQRNFSTYLAIEHQLLQMIYPASYDAKPLQLFAAEHKQELLSKSQIDAWFSQMPLESRKEEKPKRAFASPSQYSSSLLLEKSYYSDEDLDKFYSLPINESDKKIVRYIIKTMAEKNMMQLLMEKKGLEKKGKKIRHIHPLRFIGFILSDEGLKRNLKAFSKNYFKWSNFVEGFVDRMKEEGQRGQLMPYVPGFAKELHADPEQVAKYIQNRDYEKLIEYFL